MENKTKRHYIVKVEFKNGSIGKYKTALLDNGDIIQGTNDVVNLYCFRNDKGGQTLIDAQEVLVISTYEDEGEKQIKINNPGINVKFDEDAIFDAIKQLARDLKPL